MILSSLLESPVQRIGLTDPQSPDEVAIIIIIDIMINLMRWSSHSLSPPSSIISTCMLSWTSWYVRICIWPVTRWLRRWPLLWQLIGFEHSSYPLGCCLNLPNLNLLILCQYQERSSWTVSCTLENSGRFSPKRLSKKKSPNYGAF